MKQFDTFLYRGPRPQSMEWLKNNGFKRVINLESGTFEFLHQEAYEVQVDADFGLSEKNFHMSDIFAPTTHRLTTIATMLHLYKVAGMKTYVHCLHGNDRTGMVVAAYRILQNGFAVETAINEMFSEGFHKWPYLYLLNWPKNLWKIENEY